MSTTQAQPKKKHWAYLVWAFSGLFGGHRFYLRRFRTGLTFFCLMIFGGQFPEPLKSIVLLFLYGWAFVDLFLIPGMVQSCNNGKASPITSEKKTVSEPGHSPVQKRLAQMQAEPPSLPVWAQSNQVPAPVRAPVRQAEHLARSVSTEQISPGDTYEIEYADADGVYSKRTIDVRTVSVEPWGTYITAWCHTRRASRTFRAERILSARPADTATPIRDITQHFHAYVPEKDLPDPDHDAVMSRVKPDLGVLIWIAMADREITVDEEAILMDFIEERNNLTQAEFAGVPWSTHKASILVNTLRPTFNTAMGQLGRISKTGQVYKLLKRYAERIADEGGQAAQKRMKQLFPDSPKSRVQGITYYRGEIRITPPTPES